MSLTLNMVGGGGGGLSSTDALLRVQAPAGSTVTISKDGTTKTDQGHENADDNTVFDYYFIIHSSQFDSVNPWSVAATDEGITNTKTIIIDASDEYNLTFRCQVPDGYQEVEYLQSSGTQYIIPDWSLSSDWFDGTTEVEVKYLTTQNAGGHVMGSWIGNSASTYVRSYAIFNYSSNGAKRNIYIGKGIAMEDLSMSINTGITTNISGSGTSITVTDSLLGTRTGVLTDFNSEPIYIFGAYNGYSHTFDSGSALKGRIYYFTVKRNETMVKDLVPCYRESDSVAGMYDRVTKNFYTNQGSGSFTVGGDIAA